jgi:hypothetical protein
MILDIFTFATEVRYSLDLSYRVLSKSAENSKKIVWPSDRFIIAHDFLGHVLYTGKGPNFFIYNMDFMGIKRHRILRRFQKYKFTSATKCTYKKLLQKKEFYYIGGPLCTDKIFIWNIFIRCIL